jgi:hypothetical protein
MVKTDGAVKEKKPRKQKGEKKEKQKREPKPLNVCPANAI